MRHERATANPVSRRRFLHGATASAAFLFVPGRALGLNGAKPASERLHIAGIGIGGQGRHDLKQLESENIVALCDVDSQYAAPVFADYSQAKTFTDYRRMLDELPEIDAVVIATPDHTHACIAIEAMRRGKHVYCEKPLTHSVWEARQLGEAAQKFKVATQMGNQGQASEDTRRLVEMVADNAIGPVREAHVWTDRPSNGLFNVYWPQGVERPTDAPATPSTLDWDLWLGPAPERPYHSAYLPFRWRGWWDFGTGALGDIGCHAMDPIFRALELGHPTSVEASSTRVNNESYPLASMVTYRFPARGEMPELKLVWYDGGLRPSRPVELDAEVTMDVNGKLLVGDNGKIMSINTPTRRGYSLIPESRAREYGDPPKTLPRSIGHYNEWIEACKGGPAAGSHFEWAAPLTEVVLLGNVALRPEMREELTQHRLAWNSPELRFTNSATANQFLRREYRAGWTL